MMWSERAKESTTGTGRNGSKRDEVSFCCSRGVGQTDKEKRKEEKEKKKTHQQQLVAKHTAHRRRSRSYPFGKTGSSRLKKKKNENSTRGQRGRERERRPGREIEKGRQRRTLEESTSLLLDLMQTVKLADHEEDVSLGSSGSYFGSRSEHSENVTGGRGRVRPTDQSEVSDERTRRERNEPSGVKLREEGENEKSASVEKRMNERRSRRTLAATNRPCETASIATSLLVPDFTLLA